MSVTEQAEIVQDMATRIIRNGKEPHYAKEKFWRAFHATAHALVDELGHDPPTPHRSNRAGDPLTRAGIVSVGSGLRVRRQAAAHRALGRLGALGVPPGAHRRRRAEKTSPQEMPADATPQRPRASA